MPLPTSRPQFHGAALIAPTYRITIKVMPPSSSSHYSIHIHAIDNATEVPRTRAHRSFGTTINDWRYENLTWNSSDPNRGSKYRPRIKGELERKHDQEDEEKAREIRNLAQQRGARVPDKREALAMACLARIAGNAVSRARNQPHLGVTDEKDFFVVSSRSGELVEANLYVDGREKHRPIAKGSGDDHYRAVLVLENEVAANIGRLRAEEERRRRLI